MVKFSMDQVRRFLQIPDAQRLWRLTMYQLDRNKEMVPPKHPNGVLVKQELIDIINRDYKAFIQINDDDHMDDREFDEFCGQFIVTLRGLGI